jgi:hypothetical protein
MPWRQVETKLEVRTKVQTGGLPQASDHLDQWRYRATKGDTVQGQGSGALQSRGQTGASKLGEKLLGMGETSCMEQVGEEKVDRVVEVGKLSADGTGVQLGVLGTSRADSGRLWVKCAVEGGGVCSLSSSAVVREISTEGNSGEVGITTRGSWCEHRCSERSTCPDGLCQGSPALQGTSQPLACAWPLPHPIPTVQETGNP